MVDQSASAIFKVKSAYFNETGNTVQMNIQDLNFFANNTISIKGSDKYGDFEISGHTNMTKLVLEKKYSNGTTIYIAALLFDNKIKGIYGSVKDYASMFSSLNQNFFHLEIELEAKTLSANTLKVWIREDFSENDSFSGIILKNFKYHLILFEKGEESSYKTKIVVNEEIEEGEVNISSNDIEFK